MNYGVGSRGTRFSPVQIVILQSIVTQAVN